jgi:hypothetical protein
MAVYGSSIVAKCLSEAIRVAIEYFQGHVDATSLLQFLLLCSVGAEIIAKSGQCFRVLGTGIQALRDRIRPGVDPVRLNSGLSPLAQDMAQIVGRELRRRRVLIGLRLAMGVAPLSGQGVGPCLP